MNLKMLANYLKTTLRNLRRNKVYALINLLGLAIGVFSFVMIMLFVNWEFSYDKFYSKADRIYRIGVDAIIGNTEIHQVYTPAPLPAALYESFPQIEAVTRVNNVGMVRFTVDDKIYMTDNVFLVDSTFGDIFDLKLIEGNEQKLLKDPGTVLVSEKAAHKFFGEPPYLNRTIKGPDGKEVRISGVFENVPANTHFKYDMLVSLMSVPEQARPDGWFNNRFHCYLLLQEGYDYQELEKQLPTFVSNYLFQNQTYEEFEKKGNKWVYYLQPLTDIHLTSDLSGEFEPNGRKEYVDLFIIIGFFILIIACINFMNLSTARSAQRAREVAVRKIFGATRKQLIVQFLGESFLFTILGLILAMALVESVLPMFRNYIGKPIELNYFENLYTIPFLLGITFIIGLLSGSYPALYLSSFNPVAIIKDKIRGRKGSIWFRNTLVIFQFAIAIFLIAGTFIVTKQLHYLQDKNLGFDKEQVLVVNNASFLGDKIPVFKEEAKKIAGVEAVSVSHTIPGKSHNNIGSQPEGMDEGITLNFCLADYDFMKVMKFKLNKGRYFSNEYASDSLGIVINKSALDLIGWGDDFNKKIKVWVGGGHDVHVIGVADDFHYESKHQQVRPMGILMLDFFNWNSNYISVRMNTTDAKRIIGDLENLWKTSVESLPFDYSFLDESYDALYKNEAQTMEVFTIFSVLAIFVACLGLFGLATYMAEKKTKEIGIRKSLGATTSNVTGFFLSGFIRWVVLAGIIATPLAYFGMKNWLQNFAYRVSPEWYIFIASMFIAMVIAIITVIFQTLKAAGKNPVDSLRYE